MVRTPLVVFAFTLCLQAVGLEARSRADPLWGWPVGASATTLAAARGITEFGLPTEHVFFHPPLYPYLLADALTAGGVGAAFTAQAVAAAAIAAGAAALARHIAGTNLAGWVAGIAVAAHPAMLHATGELLDGIVVAALLLGVAAATVMMSTRPAAATVAGGLLGACALARPGLLVLAPAIALLAGAHGNHRRFATFLLTLALVVAPATLHNRFRGESGVWIAWAPAVEVWAGNQRNAEGLPPRPPAVLPRLFSDTGVTARATAGVAMRGPVAAEVAAAWWWGRAWHECTRDPAAAARRIVTKFRALLADVDVPYGGDPSWSAYWSGLPQAPVTAAILGVLAATFGVLATQADTRRLLILLALGAVPLILTWVDTNGRLPLLPLAAVLAGVGLSRLRNPLRPRTLLLAALGVLLAYSPSIVPDPAITRHTGPAATARMWRTVATRAHAEDRPTVAEIAELRAESLLAPPPHALLERERHPKGIRFAPRR